MDEQRTVTRVLRIRSPRDRRFLYAKYERTGWRIQVHIEWIDRRYWSKRRIEVMTFRRVTPGGTQ